MTNDDAHNIPCNDLSVACKQKMVDSIADWISRDPLASKKRLAIELGVPQTTLSHWLSFKTGMTIPAHLVGEFCRVTGSWSLHRWMDPREHQRIERCASSRRSV